MARPIIVCYDGSRASSEALDYVAEVLPSAPVLVVTVWRELTEEMLSSGAAPPAGDPVEVNVQSRDTAQEAARAGAERARAAGLDAKPLAVRTTGAIWRAIEAVAHERDALLVVCGTGRSGLKTVMPGDVAIALVQHSSKPVLVVPTGKAASERRKAVERSQRPREPVR